MKGYNGEYGWVNLEPEIDVKEFVSEQEAEEYSIEHELGFVLSVFID